MVILGALKLLTTSLTLGSGGSGGIFSLPSSWGRRLEARSAWCFERFSPAFRSTPRHWPSREWRGSSRARLALRTAIVMTFEMTLDYSVVLPMTLTVPVSHGLRRLIIEQNIYTMKLARRGHYMPQALQANAHLVHHVGDMTMATAAALAVDVAADSLAVAQPPEAPTYFVVADGEKVIGVISSQWAADIVRCFAPRPRSRTSSAATSSRWAAKQRFFDLIATMQRGRADSRSCFRPRPSKRAAPRGSVGS